MKQSNRWRHWLTLPLATLSITLSSCDQTTPDTNEPEESSAALQSQLFLELPSSCPTPDGMTLDAAGNLILTCPNYADTSKPALIVKIDQERKLSVLAECPILEKTGRAAPMGIDAGPDGSLYVADNQGWLGTPEGKNEGRILKLKFSDGKLINHEVIAHGMSHPNGIKYHKGHLYVTQSLLPKVGGDKLTSAVYRFKATDRNIKVNNDLSDPSLLQSFLTHNLDCQYGLDGLVFDKQGHLYVGNFGDGTLHKITFKEDDSVDQVSLFAKGPEMRTIDGICIDANSNIYVADFSANRVTKVRPDGSLSIVAEHDDCDGAQGGLDQPGEPIVFGDQLVVSCFDMVTGPDKVNTQHDKPHTLASIPMESIK
ncbi:SMP-30/gluconolactonase/LRE family protein [Rubritalea marina]|uniref:SMP-30/gluconolactonase/LRE family protein n=1 Tax=Rubritalea marina TaxID=361055 RepID=UPI000365E5F4|nr:SMP-30/gluconolactonase/LRE family protein [Rubritalea marina]